MQTVLVTGATGFLGLHSVRLLLEKGYTVIGTTRSAEKGQHLRAILQQLGTAIDRLQLVVADLSDAPERWAEHLSGVEGVLHVASPFPRVQPKDDTAIVRAARQGVLNVLKGADLARVRRVVLVSSTGAVGYGVADRHTFTEADWTDATNTKATTPYFRSKTLAERAAWDFVDGCEGPLELAVVNPGLILGPVLDAQDYGTSAGLVVKMLDGSMPALPNIGYAMVDVRDVADLLHRCLVRPEAAGERFIGVSAYHRIAEVVGFLQEHYPERRLPKRTLPNFLLRLIALLDAETAPVLIELNADRRFSSEKARRLLDWQPRPMRESVVATAESLLAQQFVS